MLSTREWNSRSIISLFEMIKQFHPLFLALACTTLKSMSDKADSDLPINAELVRAFKRGLYTFKLCTEFMPEMELDVWLGQADAFLKRGAPRSEFKERLDDIQKIVNHELMSHYCYVLPREAHKYMDESAISNRPFARIEKCQFDIIEARRALAFGLNTACVYHCMCALEQVWPELQKQCRKLRVGWTTCGFTSENWRVLLNTLDKEIKIAENLSRSDKRKQRLKPLSEISAFMWSVKNAWRNDTMHARGQFAEGIAESILEQTCNLLDFVVTLNHKSSTNKH